MNQPDPFDPSNLQLAGKGLKHQGQPAQSAMRHSTIDLTMNVYTDPKLLDIDGAVDPLPALPLNCEKKFRA
jgi:hypothetical protein